MTHVFPITHDPMSIQSARNAVMQAPDGHVVTFEHRITLTKNTRGRALEVIGRLWRGCKVKIAKRNRTLEQNDKMWAMLTDISIQKPEGRKCTPDDWKCLVMHACGHDVQFMEGLDGKPFPTGFKSSQLNVSEMANLIEWIYAYGNEHGVVWSEPEYRGEERKSG